MPSVGNMMACSHSITIVLTNLDNLWLDETLEIRQRGTDDISQDLVFCFPPWEFHAYSSWFVSPSNIWTFFENVMYLMNLCAHDGRIRRVGSFACELERVPGV